MSVAQKINQKGTPEVYYTSILVCPKCGPIVTAKNPNYFISSTNKEDWAGHTEYGMCFNHSHKLRVFPIDPTEGLYTK